MKIDWDSMEKEAVERLRGMIRFDTTNPPGNELPLVRHLAEELEREGLEPQLLESEGGLKRNVIPSEATAQLSGRPLPGVTKEEFLNEVREIVGEGVELRMESFRPGVEFDHRTALFDAIAAGIGKYDPEGVVVPYMQTGGTDARFLAGVDMAIYGFIPMRYESGLDFFDLCHGHDERVSLANVRLGVQVLFDVVCRLNGVEG